MLNNVLVIEDNPSDLREAARILQDLGVQEIQTITRIPLAIECLRDIAQGRRRSPDLVVLDLNFEHESGFEVLRFWKSAPQLKQLRIVVWTAMGDLEQNIAGMFGVERVLDKSVGTAELGRAMREHLAGSVGA